MSFDYTIKKLEEMRINLEKSAKKYSDIGQIMTGLNLNEKAGELKKAIDLLQDCQESP